MITTPTQSGKRGELQPTPNGRLFVVARVNGGGVALRDGSVRAPAFGGPVATRCCLGRGGSPGSMSVAAISRCSGADT